MSLRSGKSRKVSDREVILSSDINGGYIMTRALKDWHGRVSVGGQCVDILRYADESGNRYKL